MDLGWTRTCTTRKSDGENSVILDVSQDDDADFKHSGLAMKCFTTALIESLEVSDDGFFIKLTVRSLYDRGIEIEVYIIEQNKTVSPLKFAFEAFFSPLCSLPVAKTNNVAISFIRGALPTYIGILVCA
jgi:hypothetical protein